MAEIVEVVEGGKVVSGMHIYEGKTAYPEYPKELFEVRVFAFNSSTARKALEDAGMFWTGNLFCLEYIE